MKKFTKLLGIVLIIALVMSMGTMALAEDPPYEQTEEYNITVNGNAHDTFKAVQIFKGTQVVDGENDNPLGDIEWGEKITDAIAAQIINAVNTVAGWEEDDGDHYLPSDTSALKVAQAISSAITTDAQAIALAHALHPILKDVEGTTMTSGETNQVVAGYYLIVDTGELGQNDAYNASLLQMTRDITITKKTDAPTQDKEVKENTKVSTNEGWNEVADYNIGDDVPFKITSKVPDMTYYNDYTMTFTDEMSAGLLFYNALVMDSINHPEEPITDPSAALNKMLKVKVGSTELAESADYELGFLVKEGETVPYGFTVTLNLKADGTAQTWAVKDAPIEIDFYARLTKDAVIGLDGNTNKSKLTYSNNPDEDTTSTTPEDTVIVFTYELDVTKIDGADKDKAADQQKKLAGAQFTLKNSDEKYVVVDANGIVKYWTSDTPTADAEPSSEGYTSVLTSGSNGLFTVKGLDDGTYTLKEIKAPTGYNLLTEEITLVISGTTVHTADGETASDALKGISLKVDKAEPVDGDTSTGIVSTTVLNNSGTVLPSTGGIGTTIFYVVGSILVVAAGVLLITKKRMSREG